MNWAQWILFGWFMLMALINASARGKDVVEPARWANIAIALSLAFLTTRT